MASYIQKLSAGMLLLALGSGCGYTQNVRAYRAYAYESPSLDVALDRTEDLSVSLALVEKLLTGTPVTPGDAWLDQLALSDQAAKAIRDEIKQKPPYSEGNGYEVPVVKLYRVHLERVLAQAKGEGKYPSILDAMGALGDDSGKLRQHWEDLARKTVGVLEASAAYEKALKRAYPPGAARNPLNDPPEVQAAAKARDEARDEAKQAEKALGRDIESIKQGGGSGDRVELLKAVTAATTVAYRVELEALAMLPIVAIQAIRSLPSAKEELSKKPSAALRGVGQLADVPDHIDEIKERMSRQAGLLELMSSALVAASKTTLESTAGFTLKESVVDQVVGVTLDSLRAQLKAGGEAFFYSSQAQEEKTSQSQGGRTINKDLTGRLRTLTYDVKPILLTAFNLNIAFDYIKLPSAAGINLGYKTDRVFSSGGSIESGSLGQQLGLSGAASDALDLGLGVLGVKSNVRLASFTSGTVRYADAAGNPVLGADGRPRESPLQIKFTQIDLGYDLGFLLGERAQKYYIEEVTVGARYFKYELPRILYELDVTTSQDGSSETQIYKNESSPQNVASIYYMGGVTARFGRGDGPWLSPYGELGLYFGGGPTSYRLRKNKAVLCDSGAKPPAGSECVDDPNPSDRDSAPTDASAFGFDGSLALGLRLRLMKPGRRFRLSGEAVFRGELIYANAKSSFTSTDGKSTQIDLGSADIFWGPRLNLVGEF